MALLCVYNAAQNLSAVHVIEVSDDQRTPVRSSVDYDPSQYDTLDSGAGHVRSVAELQTRVHGLEEFRDAILQVFACLHASMKAITGASVPVPDSSSRSSEQHVGELAVLVQKLEASRMQAWMWLLKLVVFGWLL